MEAQAERMCSWPNLFCTPYCWGAVLFRLLLIQYQVRNHLRLENSQWHAPCYVQGCLHCPGLAWRWSWVGSCLQEAAVSQSGYQLRLLFVKSLPFVSSQTLFAYGPDFGCSLWWSPSQGPWCYQSWAVWSFCSQRANAALIHIQLLLRNLGKTLGDYQGMPEPVMLDQHRPSENPLIADELSYPLLTPEEIAMNMDSMLTRACIRPNQASYEMDTSEAFFIDGPAGTGKTFLYSLILSMVRSNRDIALAVAGSGIAALLLQGGRTAHSRFKVPVAIHEDSACSVNHRSSIAYLLIRPRSLSGMKPLWPIVSFMKLLIALSRTWWRQWTLRMNISLLEERSWSLVVTSDRFHQLSSEVAEKRSLLLALKSLHFGIMSNAFTCPLICDSSRMPMLLTLRHKLTLQTGFFKLERELLLAHHQTEASLLPSDFQPRWWCLLLQTSAPSLAWFTPTSQNRQSPVPQAASNPLSNKWWCWWGQQPSHVSHSRRVKGLYLIRLDLW